MSRGILILALLFMCPILHLNLSANNSEDDRGLSPQPYFEEVHDLLLTPQLHTDETIPSKLQEVDRKVRKAIDGGIEYTPFIPALFRKAVVKAKKKTKPRRRNRDKKGLMWTLIIAGIVIVLGGTAIFVFQPEFGIAFILLGAAGIFLGLALLVFAILAA